MSKSDLKMIQGKETVLRQPLSMLLNQRYHGLVVTMSRAA